MGKKDKREQKLWAAGRNVRFEDAVAALQAAGFVCKPGSRNHWYCRHAASGVFLNIAPPHGREKKLLASSVKDAREALEKVRAWERERGDDDGNSD